MSDILYSLSFLINVLVETVSYHGNKILLIMLFNLKGIVMLMTFVKYLSDFDYL